MTIRLFLLLILKAFIIIAVIFYGGIGLGPDEAQYWTWSQSLDWGYYSKPPGIAWQIWVGTHLFGESEWGVRSVSVILGMLQAFAMYRLALCVNLSKRAAYWCALFMAFSPLGILGSFLAITDGGFLLCWTVACLAVASPLHRGEKGSAFLIGVWIGIGALFKWPIYLFWIFVVFCRRSILPGQSLFSLAVGILISLLGLLPSVWWNVSHDWATFRHVFATVQGGSGHRASGNLLEFIGSQALLLSPILFVLLLLALFQWFKKRKEVSPALYFCGIATSTSLMIVTLLSCFQKIQGNWITFAYPTALVILAWDVFKEHPKRAWWAKMGVVFSLLLTLVLFLLPLPYVYPKINLYALPYRMNPFKHNMGWSALIAGLEQSGYDPKKDFLFSDKYQTTSELSFYGPDRKRAYFLNLQGVRNNQFSYWPGLEEECSNKIGYFVWVENSPHLQRELEKKKDFYETELQKYFEKVEMVGLFPLLFEGEKMVKGGVIFRCEFCKERKVTGSSLF